MIAVSLMLLDNSPKSRVLFYMGIAFRNGDLCWPSYVSIARHRNGGLKAALCKEGRELEQFRGEGFASVSPYRLVLNSVVSSHVHPDSGEVREATRVHTVYIFTQVW